MKQMGGYNYTQEKPIKSYSLQIGGAGLPMPELLKQKNIIYFIYMTPNGPEFLCKK